ncbi:hypothetical protein SLE2022_327140 [Rubroshorea leprosula]
MRKRDRANDLGIYRNHRRIEPEMRTGKIPYSRAESENWVYCLNLQINHAEGLDPPILYPELPIGERNYRVVFWVGSNPSSDRRYATSESGEALEPVWKERAQIPLGRFLDPEVLNVEVVRVNAWSDPGPSTGIVLVGRTQIPLPSPWSVSKKKGGRFGLVRPVGDGYRGEGHISISMELKRARAN